MSDDLPDFVIAGAMRSGTTSLFRYLGVHPGICMAGTKEVHFFDYHFDRGLAWYASQFDCSRPDQLLGEATPAYMSNPIAVGRMAETLPKARIVVSLREPVDRLWSHYWMRVERGHEHRGFEHALHDEMSTFDAEGPDAKDLHYLKNSLYVHHLRRILRHYFRDQLHVVIFERMTGDPVEEYLMLCRFLEIDESYRPLNLGDTINPYVRFRSLTLRRIMRRLPYKIPRRIVARLNTKRSSYQVLEPKARENLTVFFTPFNIELETLLGRSIPEWPRDAIDDN